MTNESAPAGGVPVDPPEPEGGWRHEQCALCRLPLKDAVAGCPNAFHPRRPRRPYLSGQPGEESAAAAGGVVQPPADPGEQMTQDQMVAYRDALDTLVVSVLRDEMGPSFSTADAMEVGFALTEELGHQGFLVGPRQWRPVRAAGGEGTDGD